MAAASSSRVGGSAPQVNPTARNTVIATKLDAAHLLWIIARLQPNSTADDGRLPPLNSGRHSPVRVAGGHCAASDLGTRLPPTILHRGAHAADRARHSRCPPRSCTACRRGATSPSRTRRRASGYPMLTELLAFLPSAILHRGAHAADRARGRSRCQ